MNSEKKPISNTTGNTTTDKIKMKDSGIKDINEIQNQSEINRKTKSNFENDSMPSSSKGRLKIFLVMPRELEKPMRCLKLDRWQKTEESIR